MRNTIKLQPQRLPSAERKKSDKGVAVLKCFICNQMFYTENSFSQHMQEHSSKINRNVPEEIQRKTMESFRSKKNTGDNGQLKKDKDKIGDTIDVKKAKINSRSTEKK